MTRPVPLVAAFALLFVSTDALAQLPVAPAPHIPLADFGAEYRWYQLPLPSHEAQLVHVKWRSASEKPYALAFRHEPTKPGDPVHYLLGGSWHHDLQVEITLLPQPTPADLEGLDEADTDWLTLTAQCWFRGWKDIAAVAYAKAITQLSKPRATDSPTTISQQLYAKARAHLKNQLTEQKTDRKEILVRLDHIATTAPEVLLKLDKQLLADLKQTLAPRKSKPGSIEALIDDLTEDWTAPEDSDDENERTAYWKLIERGFDAVPALIEHRKDTRLTRNKREWVQGTGDGIHIVRIGELVEYILNNLSAGRFEREAYPLTAGPLIGPKDHEWWAEARKVGEEEWLVENVFPKGKGDEPFPNAVILRVIRAKYPYRLVDVYQALLLKYPHVSSEPVTKAIRASRLLRKEKIAMFELGAANTNKERDHRVRALDAIAELDPTVFQKHLLRLLEGLLPEVRFRQNEYNSDLGLVALVRKTDDRRCWKSLTDLSKRVSPTTRMDFIRAVSGPVETNERDAGRGEYLRYVLACMDDTTRGDEPRDGLLVIRDYATLQLALTLGRITREESKRLKSPRELDSLRTRVRELAKRELARSTK